MARRVMVTLVDDTDETQTADETVEFGLDGATYEIDLSTRNAARLRTNLDEWIASARHTQGRARRHPAVADSRSASIRAWARRRGIQVNDKGRIASAIIAEYEADQEAGGR